MKKFDSIVDCAVEQAEIESLRRREQKIVEDIGLILQAFAEDDDEYGEDEFDDEDDDE